MDTYSNRIKELRKMRGLTQQALADKLDVNKVTVSQYERGVRKPDINVVAALCDIFNVSSDYLLGKDDVTIRLVGKDGLNRLDAPKTRIPVLGCVAAGVPIDAIQDILDWEEISPEMALDGEYFALQIKGDSMAPRMLVGDVVIVRQQPDAESGDVVIVQIDGERATCKKLMKHSEGISLLSFNPSYDPITFTNKEIESLPVVILGKVVENRQKY